MTFQVVIDLDLKELAIEYLENRRKQMSSLEEAFANKDFQTIATLAHNMKGVAASYGFPELSRIGNTLEKEAEGLKVNEVRALLDETITYLANVKIEFKNMETS